METWKTKDGREITAARSRPHRVTLRFTDEELEQFKSMAVSAGMSQQEYGRKAVLNQTIVNTDGMRDGLREIASQLKHQGNNLNQIAKSLNAMSYVSPRSIDQAVKEMGDVWLQLKLFLQKHQ